MPKPRVASAVGSLLLAILAACRPATPKAPPTVLAASQSPAAAERPAPTAGQPGPAAGAEARAGLSLRFIARKQETQEEIPAGHFEVRLVSLAPVRGAGSGSAEPPPSPRMVLVTQPDGTAQTFVVGVEPGEYALRITARGRKMLLRTLVIRPTDRLFDVALDPEPQDTPDAPTGP